MSNSDIRSWATVLPYGAFAACIRISFDTELPTTPINRELPGIHAGQIAGSRSSSNGRRIPTKRVLLSNGILKVIVTGQYNKSVSGIDADQKSSGGKGKSVPSGMLFLALSSAWYALFLTSWLGSGRQR